MPDIENRLARLAQEQKLGLWRTHPSFFWLAFFLMVENFVFAHLFLVSGRRYASSVAYDKAFDYLPTWGYGALFLISATLMATAFITKKHYLVRIGATFALIPTAMLTMALVYGFTNNTFSSIPAITKWMLPCILYMRMLKEPFTNILAAK